MGLTEECATVLEIESNNDFLLKCYQSSINYGELTSDIHQHAVVIELQEVFNYLLTPPAPKTPSRPRLVNLFSSRKESTGSKRSQTHQKGLYLWGGVGRGKTHLVDYFYKLLPIEKKLRLHFHRFMQLVHEELNQLDSVADPLQTVARNMAEKADLLVLDEMHVNDITDAMLLGRLFEHLFNLGVVLVTTSNIPPHELYKNGLQRDRFLPAIRLLEQYTKVVKMGGDEDYRLQTLEQTGLYQIASGSLSERRLERYFHQLSGMELHRDRKEILINNRHISVKMWADGVVWFSFDELCNTPRSAEDYNQIASFFHTVLISDIPVMDRNKDDSARRFITMIDGFYDCHVNLVVSADAEPERLYTSNKLKFEFQRTASRLREMQSKDYITIQHLQNDPKKLS